MSNFKIVLVGDAPHISKYRNPETVCGENWNAHSDTDPNEITCELCHRVTTLPHGQKVTYRTGTAGKILGRVVREAYRVPGHGWCVDIEVTSRRNPTYPRGLLVPCYLSNSALTTR